MRSYMYYHEIMETEILPQYLSLKVGAYVRTAEERVEREGWIVNS